MTKWIVMPKESKSIVEQQVWSKGDETFLYIIHWRGGSFYLYTEGDTPPVLEQDLDIMDTEYEVELNETHDAYYETYDFDSCNEETEEWLNEFLNENGNKPYDLEEHGWECVDSSTFINGPLEIIKDNEQRD